MRFILSFTSLATILYGFTLVSAIVLPTNLAVDSHLKRILKDVEQDGGCSRMYSRTCHLSTQRVQNRDLYPLVSYARSQDQNHGLFLERRAAKYKNVKKNPSNNKKAKKSQTHTPAKVSFSGGAKKHLDNLGLHGKDRKNVKKYHSKVAKKEMGKKGADSAQIKHLAHTEGSKDPKMHMTANLWDKDNKRMKSTYGNPPKKGDLHHLYTGSKPLPKAYTNAVAKKGGK